MDLFADKMQMMQLTIYVYCSCYTIKWDTVVVFVLNLKNKLGQILGEQEQQQQLIKFQVR